MATGQESTCDASQTIKICFKLSGGPQFNLDLKLSMTVDEVKREAEQHCQVPQSQQRLIYKGRILKDHEKLSDLKVGDGHTMHLVKSGGAVATTTSTEAAPPTTTPPAATAAATAGATTAPLPQQTPTDSTSGMGLPPFMAGLAPGAFPRGMPNMPPGMPNLLNMPPGSMEALLSDPASQQMFQTMFNNPEMLRTVMQNDPYLSQQNPLMRSIVENPDMFRSAVSLLRNSFPQQPGGAATNITTPPATAIPNPLVPPATGMPTPTTATPGAGGSPGGMADLMQMSMSIMRENPDLMRNIMMNPNLMNPNLMNQNLNPAGANAAFASMFGAGGMGAGGMPPATDTRPPEERYRIQLDRLQEMGFIDRDANLQTLTEANGDVDEAITRLLDRGIGN